MLPSIDENMYNELLIPIILQNYPYTGPAVPIADWVDQSINGNGKGFIRLVEKPAVTPAKNKVKMQS